MKHSTLRYIILILGLITAIVHLVVLNIFFIQDLGRPDLLFTLNGLGYLALTAAYYFQFPFLARVQRLVPWAFIAFAAITILAWYFMNGLRSPLGWLTKLDELALIIVLFLDMQASR
jgi:hypothetical protein